MSQSILAHIHGERFARIEPHSTLTGTPLRTPTEAAEARAHRGFTFGPIGRGMAHNVRTGKDLDVQVQIEQAVMVDYDPRTHRQPREFWERKQSGIANRDTSPGDQGQWELSRVAKMAGAV
jgi:hypothetical protein